MNRISVAAFIVIRESANYQENYWSQRIIRVDKLSETSCCDLCITCSDLVFNNIKRPEVKLFDTKLNWKSYNESNLLWFIYRSFFGPRTGMNFKSSLRHHWRKLWPIPPINPGQYLLGIIEFYSDTSRLCKISSNKIWWLCNSSSIRCKRTWSVQTLK